MSTDIWYWRRNGMVYGPVDAEAFASRIADGRVGRNDPVRQGHHGPWQRLEAYGLWSELLEQAESMWVRAWPTRSKGLYLTIGFGLAVLGLGLALFSPADPSTTPDLPPASGPPPTATALEEPERPPKMVVAPTAKSTSKKKRKKRANRSGPIKIGSDTAPKDGGLSSQVIAKGFRRGLPRIQACAKRYATSGGQVPEKMAVSYAIRNSGSVTEAKVRPPEVARTPLGSCIVGVLRRLQYPSYRGEARSVSFPLAFNQK